MTLLLLAGVAHADPLGREPLDLGGPGGSEPPPAPVVGGQDVPPGQWPDAAALYTINDTFGCTGVLVAPDVVLTAGHCGYGLETVVLGTNDHRSGGLVLPIAEAFVHEDPYTTFDVTALVLAEPVATVPPRLLLRDCLVGDYLREGAEVAIVGFGATDEWATQWDTVLQEARTTVTDPECEDLSTGCNEDVSPGGELVAGGDGIDSCSGDSGGPLYLPTPEGDFLVGLTSRAAVPATTPCGGGGIYVRADAIAGWVEEVTGRELARPDCEGINRSPSPVAGDIAVAPGEVGVTHVEPGDPNAGDTHVFELAEPPDQGVAQVFADGTVTFRGDASTSFVVGVVDQDGARGEVTIDVEVVVGQPGARVEPSGGCRTAPGPLWALAPGLLLLARRRR
jgi:hypothetical protein